MNFLLEYEARIKRLAEDKARALMNMQQEGQDELTYNQGME